MHCSEEYATAIAPVILCRQVARGLVSKKGAFFCHQAVAIDDFVAQLRAADFLLGTGNIAAAFDRLLDVVSRTSGEDRDRARTHLVDLFSVVGNDDPRVSAARRRLTTALF